MAVQRAVAERWKQVTGKPLIEAYGLTETSPAATINRLDIDEYTGSIGLPMPSTEIAIRDAEGGPGDRRRRRTLHPRTAGDGRLLGQARRDRRRARPPTASCAPATSRASTSAASSISSTARRT